MEFLLNRLGALIECASVPLGYASLVERAAGAATDLSELDETKHA